MNLYSAIPQMCHILFSVVALPFLVNEIFHEFKKTTKNVLVLLANFWGGLAPHANNLIKHVYTGFFSYFTVNNVQTNRFQQLLDQLWFNLFQVNKVWLISNIKNKKKKIKILSRRTEEFFVDFYLYIVLSLWILEFDVCKLFFLLRISKCIKINSISSIMLLLEEIRVWSLKLFTFFCILFVGFVLHKKVMHGS